MCLSAHACQSSNPLALLCRASRLADARCPIARSWPGLDHFGIDLFRACCRQRSPLDMKIFLDGALSEHQQGYRRAALRRARLFKALTSF